MGKLGITVVAVLLIRVADGPARGQQCSIECQPDFNGNNRVEINELVRAVNLLLSECPEEFFFEENFSGTVLDSTHWVSFTNGYPPPGIAVNSGVQLGQAGTNSLDFPYVHSVGTIFPTDGNFRLEIVAQYTSLAGNGDGFQILDSAGVVPFGFWADQGIGLVVGISDARAQIASPTSLHTYIVDFVGSKASLSVDGLQVLSDIPVDGRPDHIWFGSPSIGQEYTTDAASLQSYVDSAGNVAARWWVQAVWSTFRVQSINVQLLPAVAR